MDCKTRSYSKGFEFGCLFNVKSSKNRPAISYTSFKINFFRQNNVENWRIIWQSTLVFDKAMNFECTFFLKIYCLFIESALIPISVLRFRCWKLESSFYYWRLLWISEGEMRWFWNVSWKSSKTVYFCHIYDTFMSNIRHCYHSGRFDDSSIITATKVSA